MAILLEGTPILLFGAVIICAVVLPTVVIGNLIRRLVSDEALPKNLPWAGVGPNGGAFARLRANLSSFFRLKDLMEEGYTKYSKRGRTYVLPHILTGPEVVLPLSQVRWLVEQPETILSQTEVNRTFLEADHTFLHSNIVREPVHPEVIRRELTHKLSSFANDIVDELEKCLEENWGTDTENWREIHVYNTLLDIISRLSTRVFVGQELCANKEFLKAARTFDKNVVVSAAAINLLPEFLKPVLGPIITIYDYLQYRTCAKFVLPIVNERLQQLKPSNEKLPLFGRKPSNDYVQWAIGHALNHWDPVELEAAVIAKRLACLCFAAIQSSVISLTNTLFDIASSPHCAEWLAAMRDEALTEVAAASAGRAVGGGSDSRAFSPWGKATLAKMVCVDSALRESMRLNGFVARGIMKAVVAREGVRLPDGSLIPYGTKIGVQAYSIHRDEDVYVRADEYDALRFVSRVGTARQERKAGGKSDASSSSTACASGSDSEGSRVSTSSVVERKRKIGEPRASQPQALVTTSPTFLAFSHGPNSCPGRFFAANQLKLTLAHIALHYEIEHLPERPANKWFVGSMAPPMWHTLRIRRRKA